MTKHLILFVGSDRPGSYINVIAHALHKENVERIVFVDIVRSQVNLRVSYEKLLNVIMPEVLDDLLANKYNGQVFQPPKGFHAYEEVKHKFKYKISEEFNYANIGQEMIRIRDTYGKESIIDITSTPKRIAVEILLACFNVGLVNVGLFELKKQLSDLNALYHNLEEKEDFEYITLSLNSINTSTNNNIIEKTQQNINIYPTIVAFSLSFNIIAIFEFLVYRIPWQWLIVNSNSYAIQLTFDSIVTIFVLGFFRQDWRKWCWGSSGVGALFLVLLQILGGPLSK